MIFLKKRFQFNSVITGAFLFSCALHAQEQNYVPTEAEVISHAANFFEIDVPEELDYKLLWYSEQYDDSVEYGWGNRDLDFVEIELVFPGDTAAFISIYSVLKSRTLYSLEESYQSYIENMETSYSHLDDEWFVVSGSNKTTGGITYVKHSIGPMYWSRLTFNYPKSEREKVEAVLTQLSHSLKSH